MGGRVLADGHDITGRSLDQLVRLGIGYVPQVDDVFDPLKVSENLTMGGYLLSPLVPALDEPAVRGADTIGTDRPGSCPGRPGHAVLLAEQKAQAAPPTPRRCWYGGR
jgi:hypothetical protein